jgi:hypothetical protein
VDGHQQGLRVSAVRQYGMIGVSAMLERGEVTEASHDGASPYALASLGVRMALGAYGNVGVSATRSEGHTLTGASGELLGAGANAQFYLPGAVQIGFTMNSQRATFGVLDSSGAWFSVTDARIDRRFENGTVVGLHARMLQTPASFGSPNSSAIYLEVRSPFHVPAGRSRETGRAVGRVMDAERGTPVAGVLVRVGDQAAVSDRDGRVRFAGLDTSVHHVSVEPSAATAGAILVGDVALDMRQLAQAPAQFAVGVTRGAHVAAHVVRSMGLAVVEPASGPAPSVPEETAPMTGLLVALEGERDTLYQVTDGRGVADFGTIAPGNWTLAVRPAQAESWMEFERSRLSVTVGAGERRDVDFRLVPMQRQVRMLNGGGELRARVLPDKPREPDRP